MDLTEVEGLRDLIEAETEGQRRLARSMVGVSTGPLLNLRPEGSDTARRDELIPFLLAG